MKLNILIGSLMMDFGQAAIFLSVAFYYIKENYILTILGMGIFLAMSFFRSNEDANHRRNEE